MKLCIARLSYSSEKCMVIVEAVILRENKEDPQKIIILDQNFILIK